VKLDARKRGLHTIQYFFLGPLIKALDMMEFDGPSPSPGSPLLTFFDALHGFASKVLNFKDARGWGSSFFIVNKGYTNTYDNINSYPRSGLWNFVLHTDGLHKFNSFTWLIAHKCILATENLKKRGIVGPSRCALSSQDEESIPHMFAQYNYTKSTWILALGDSFILIDWSLSHKYFFQKWGQNYHEDLETN
jgi:hypothetical protein